MDKEHHLFEHRCGPGFPLRGSPEDLCEYQRFVDCRRSVSAGQRWMLYRSGAVIVISSAALDVILNSRKHSHVFFSRIENGSGP